MYDLPPTHVDVHHAHTKKKRKRRERRGKREEKGKEEGEEGRRAIGLGETVHGIGKK